MAMAKRLITSSAWGPSKCAPMMRSVPCSMSTLEPEVVSPTRRVLNHRTYPATRAEREPSPRRPPLSPAEASGRQGEHRRGDAGSFVARRLHPVGSCEPARVVVGLGLQRAFPRRGVAPRIDRGVRTHCRTVHHDATVSRFNPGGLESRSSSSGTRPALGPPCRSRSGLFAASHAAHHEVRGDRLDAGTSVSQLHRDPEINAYASQAWPPGRDRGLERRAPGEESSAYSGPRGNVGTRRTHSRRHEDDRGGRRSRSRN